MPNLGPGVANVVPLAVTSTWVFTPTPSVAATVSLWNTGTHTAFVGRAGANQADSFPLAPGNRPLRLQNIGYSLYGTSDVTIGAIIGTLSTNYTAGTVTIVTAASVPTASAPVGGVFIVGNTLNTGWEAITIATVSTSFTTFGTSALVSDHTSAAGIIYAGTALPTTLVAQAGVV